MSLIDHFLFVCLAHFGVFVVAQGIKRFGCEFFMGVCCIIHQITGGGKIIL